MENGQRIVGKLPEKDLLEVPEVAGYLGVKEVTIYRWCREDILPCLKLGKSWRIRREALLEFIGERERPATLTGRLRSFLEVPDNVISVSENPELMHRLDAAFFRVAEAHGGLMVKYHAGGEQTNLDELRSDLERNGLDAGKLEKEGRFHFLEDTSTAGERPQELERLWGEEASGGRSIWVAFNWEERVDLDSALHQQRRLTDLIEGTRLVVNTAVLEELADEWPTATWLRAQTVHSGTVWLSESGLSMSRVAPVRGDEP
jgi:excisionase family DNA binding protein